MPYTIVKPQPASIAVPIPVPSAPVQSPATLVQLDSGQYVALGIHCRSMRNTAQLRIDGCAMLVDAAGGQILDGNGHTVDVGYGATLSAEQSADPAQVADWQKNVALALLGEALTLPAIASDANVVAASIRHAIAASAHVGPVTDLAGVL